MMRQYTIVESYSTGNMARKFGTRGKQWCGKDFWNPEPIFILFGAPHQRLPGRLPPHYVTGNDFSKIKQPDESIINIVWLFFYGLFVVFFWLVASEDVLL